MFVFDSVSHSSEFFFFPFLNRYVCVSQVSQVMSWLRVLLLEGRKKGQIRQILEPRKVHLFVDVVLNRMFRFVSF